MPKAMAASSLALSVDTLPTPAHRTEALRQKKPAAPQSQAKICQWPAARGGEQEHLNLWDISLFTLLLGKGKHT